jgi:hypothetical protein
MNPGRMYGRVVKSIIEINEPGVILTMATENELLAMFLAGVGFLHAVMEVVQELGGPTVKEQVSMLLRAPDYPGGTPDFVAARDEARTVMMAEAQFRQSPMRGLQEAQDGAEGGEEG